MCRKKAGDRVRDLLEICLWITRWQAAQRKIQRADCADFSLGSKNLRASPKVFRDLCKKTESETI